MYQKPMPQIDAWNRPFWEACRRHEFQLQRCSGCGQYWYPPGPVCPHCRSAVWVWEKVSGRGWVWSWVQFHHEYFSSFRDEIPYNVAMIQLEEGPIILSNIVGIPNSEIKIDMPVRVVFEDVTDEVTLPKFTVAEEDGGRGN